MLISLLLLPAVELERGTVEKLRAGVTNASVEIAFHNGTNSVARIEFDIWRWVVEDFSYRLRSVLRYLLSGKRSSLTDSSASGPGHGWLYLRDGKEAVTVPSGWAFNPGHMLGDLCVWAMNFKLSASEMFIPSAWHGSGDGVSNNDSPEPRDSVMLRVRLIYALFSDYVAGLNANPPHRSAHVQHLLATHQLFLSVQDEERAETEAGQVKQNAKPQPTPHPLRAPRAAHQVVAARKPVEVVSAGLDAPVRVNDRQAVRFWQVSAADLSGLAKHPVTRLPDTERTLSGGAILRRKLDRYGSPVEVNAEDVGNGWLALASDGRTGFVPSTDYQYFTSIFIKPQPIAPGAESFEAPVIATEDIQLYIVTPELKALVMQHHDVVRREKPLAALPAGTVIRRVLNEYRRPSSGGLEDGTYGWLVSVDELNLFGLVRWTDYQRATRPAGGQR